MPKKFICAKDIVKCKVCGKLMKQITRTHLGTHDMTTTQYIEKYNLYPTELYCKSTLLKRQEIGRKAYNLPHVKKAFQESTPTLCVGDWIRKERRQEICKKIWERYTPEERSLMLSKRTKKAWKTRKKKEGKVNDTEN